MKDCEKHHDTQEYKRQLIDLLCRADKVLTEAGIEFFGVFGTCLGAIREHDIIPWDDDIDIAVRRRCFDDAVKILDQSDMQIFVDSHGFRSARIFNRVSSNDSLERKRAYIDLYVIDYAPESKVVFFWKVMWYLGVSRILARRKGVVGEAHPFAYFFVDMLVYPLRLLPTRILLRISELLYVYKKKSRFVKLSYDANRNRYLDVFFLSSKRVKFNRVTIPVPDEYDAYLTKTYGEWRIPPQECERVSHAFDATGTVWNVALPPDNDRKKRV